MQNILQSSQLPLLLIAGLIEYSIGFFALNLSKAKRTQSHILFGMISWGLAFWTTALTLFFVTDNFMFSQLSFVASGVWLSGVIIFAGTFPGKTITSNRLLLLLVPTVIPIFAAPFIKNTPPTILIQTDIIGFFGGSFAIFFTLILFYAIITSVLLLARSYTQHEKLIKYGIQFRYAIFGVFISCLSVFLFGALSTHFNVRNLNLLGITSPLLFVLATGYCLMHEKPLDIRIILQHSVIYTVILGSAFGAYHLLLSFFRLTIEGWTQEIISGLSVLSILLIGIFTFNNVKDLLFKKTNLVLFKGHRNHLKTLHSIHSIFDKNIDLETILTKFSHELVQLFQTDEVEFLLTKAGVRFDTRGFLYDVNFAYPKNFTETFASLPNIITKHRLRRSTVDGISKQHHNVLELVSTYFESRNYQLCAQIKLDGEIIGLMALGKKRGQGWYTKKDHLLIETLCHQAGIALEKARLYKQSAEYSESLIHQVNKSVSQVEELKRAREEMTMDLSHNLQTPLTIMKNEVHALQNDPQNISDHVISLEKSIDRVSGFINKVLTLNRNKEVDITEHALLDISLLLEELLESYEVVLDHQEVSLQKKIDSDLLVNGNKHRLEELFTNILSNALKYRKPNNQHAIGIDAHSIGNNIEITVTDNGLGIESAKLTKIFERSYRHAPQVHGHGLGLAICKKVCGEHRGSITAASKEGVWTSFTIVLPKYNKTAS